MKLILLKRISKCCTRLRKWGRFLIGCTSVWEKKALPVHYLIKYWNEPMKGTWTWILTYHGWRLLCKWWLVMEFLLWNQHQQQSCQVFFHQQHFSGQLSHCWHSRFDWTTEKVRRSRLGYRRELTTRVSKLCLKGYIYVKPAGQKHDLHRDWSLKITLRLIELQRNH